MNNKLIQFVREEISEFNLPIDKSTRLEHDLGLGGDDTFELLRNYSLKFNVDLSNFKYSLYISDEPSVFANNKEIKALTIEQLERGIFYGKLDENIMNM